MNFARLFVCKYEIMHSLLTHRNKEHLFYNDSLQYLTHWSKTFSMYVGAQVIPFASSVEHWC